MKFLLLLPFLALASCATTGESPARYVCACGPECGCASSADQPGTCGCGHPLVPSS